MSIDWEEHFEEKRVTWNYRGRGPHAAYSLNDHHSDFYFNSDYLISNPELLKHACDALFDLFQQSRKGKPDWIVTYPPYGMNVAFCLAELMQCRFAYIKSLDAPDLNFDIKTGQSVLFCADDLYTGTSYNKVAMAVKEKGVEIEAPILVLANFSGSSTFKEREVLALMDRTINLWSADACPLCRDGSPVLPARKNWAQLLL